ncbi:MAG TPA: hypothetical protein VFX06_17900 [Stellaceae bacterium]|nr:hypothetical protein [Stellaceae bacterium]
MVQSSSPPGPPSGLPGPEESGLADWFLYWVELGILLLLALTGAFVAADGRPGDYACGLALLFMSLALAMLRLKRRLDGEPPDWKTFFLVDNWLGLVIAVIVFLGVALIGVFVAAGIGGGSLYPAGLALTGAAVVAAFLSLKNVFDRGERR